MLPTHFRDGRLPAAAAALACAALLTAGPATAAEPLLFYPAELSAFGAEGDRAVSETPGVAVTLGASSLEALPMGERFELALPTGDTVTATVSVDAGTAPLPPQPSLAGATGSRVLAFERGAGSLEIHTDDADRIVGMTLFDRRDGTFRSTLLDGAGNGRLVTEDPEALVCMDMPLEPAGASSGEIEIEELLAAPDLAALQDLHGQPGATNVLFIDYWGGTVENTAWNSNYTGGQPIAYTPYSSDGDVGTFSAEDRYRMHLGWLEAAEDYGPFDVDVTTSRATWEATPPERRSRIIATTSRAWYPRAAGGVAFVGVFGNASDYYTTGWTWNRTPDAMGMTHAHEAGHQMGLRHDGVGSGGYYGGHGRWGPIMGAPFGKPYVQWSRGEYPGADRLEDDLLLVGGKLGTRPDDAGDDIGSATPLALPAVGMTGELAPDGLLAGSSDVDVYAFTLTTASEVSISVATRPGSLDEARAANAALNVSLADSNGTVAASIASSDAVPLSPSTNRFTFDDTLDAGTWYLSVDAVTPDPDWATGFGEYGHHGGYLVDVQASSVASAAPGAATLASPRGAVGDTTPDYTWEAVAGASWYRLWVDGPGGNLVARWYTTAEVGCVGGGSCSVTPTIVVDGDARWWVQTWSVGGYGPWSDSLAFNGGPPPAAASPLAPAGGGIGPTPEYVWPAVPGASWYRLWVQDDTGVPVERWYRGTELGCGTGTCTAAPETAVAGFVRWWVRTWNLAGYGPWSVPLDFAP